MAHKQQLIARVLLHKAHHLGQLVDNKPLCRLVHAPVGVATTVGLTAGARVREHVLQGMTAIVMLRNSVTRKVVLLRHVMQAPA